MRFTSDRVTFFSKAAKRVIYPLGSPGSQIVGHRSGHLRTVPVSKPIVEFDGGKHTERNPEIIRGMIDYPCMCDRDGYEINFADLPEEWRGMYRDLPPRERIKVLLGLCDDKDDNEILSTLDAGALDQAKNQKKSPAREYIISCPAVGCDLSIGGDTDQAQAQAAMAAHLATSHPDWNAE